MDFIITQAKGTCCFSGSKTLQLYSFNCLSPPEPMVYSLSESGVDTWTGTGNSPCGISGQVQFTLTCSGTSASLHVLCVGGIYNGQTDTISGTVDCDGPTYFSASEAGSSAQCVDLGSTLFYVT